MILFFALLVNYIITPLAKLEGQWSWSVIRRSVFNKYYLFQVFNVFLGSILASGFLKVAPQIIANPTNIIGLLASSLPKQGPYFISYIVTLSFTSFALALLRPGPLIMRFVKRRFLAKTKRDLRKAEGPYFFDAAPVQLATHLLVFLLSAVYSVMSPLILPFALIYYMCAYVATRHNLIYVYHPKHPGEGDIFACLFTRLCWSLIVFQVTLMGVLGAAKFIAAVALAPVVVLQILFWLWTDRQLHAASKYGALDADSAAVYSKPDQRMKQQTELKILKNTDPLLEKEDIEDFDEEHEDDLDTILRSSLPSKDAYLFTGLRTPLFELEDQSEQPALASEASFWAPEWQTGRRRSESTSAKHNLQQRRSTRPNVNYDVL
jgi:hypothetical protein